ncbi:MAG: VWA domain-containing protein [Acidobacteria bacterium]|nr:MAG: VWA domain-containing protein [Acidobacteriota bacterium]
MNRAVSAALFRGATRPLPVTDTLKFLRTGNGLVAPQKSAALTALFIVGVVSGFVASTSLAQTPQGERLPDSMRVTVNQVVLDVVVVDKKGQQARELSPADFEVLENGVVQKLSSVRYIGAGQSQATSAQTPTGPTAATQPVARPQTQQLNLITFIFDRISLYGRQMARQASEKYLDELGPNDFLSVVVIDTRLQVLSEFSQNRDRLRQAITLATSGNSRQFADASQEVQNAFNRAELLTERINSGMQGPARPVGGATSPNSNLPYSEEQANRALVNLLRSASRAENYIQGSATIEGLKQLVRSQRDLPGRKAMVFFAEEFQLPLGVIERFRDLVSAANRFNVSFYSVDTSGLEHGGELDKTRDELGRLARVARRQQLKTRGGVTQDEVLLAENTNEATRLSSQENLASLAASTGGTLVANTNDLLPGIKTVTADFRSHYELSYTPTNKTYDGSYRKIGVRIKRSGLTARARDGYYALPDNDLADSPFEVPLIDALAAKNPPRDLPFRSSSFLFPNPTPEPEVVFYLEVPLAGFQFPIDTKKKEYRAGVAVLVAVKNSAGKTVEKFSQDFPLKGPREKAPETQARTFLFYRTTVLPPGRYTVESAVLDSVGEKSSVKKAVLIVPAKGNAQLQLSSVLLVKRMDDSTADFALSESPLHFGKQLIVPSLDPVFKLEQWGELAFYFRVSSGLGEQVTADLVLSQEGKPVGRMGERNLPAPDERGEIKYVAGLPLESLAAGNYEAEVIIRQGDAECRSKTAFSLQ